MGNGGMGNGEVDRHPVEMFIDQVPYNKHTYAFVWTSYLQTIQSKQQLQTNSRTCLPISPFQFKVAVLIHKCLNGRAPAYLAGDCRWIRHHRAGLRSSSDMMKLDVPSTRTTFGDRSFAVNGPRVWNSLPGSIRDPSLSLTVFRNSLKTHLFVQ